jgi:hypothetical protein
MKKTMVGLAMVIVLMTAVHSTSAQEVGQSPTRVVVNVAAPIYIQPDAKLVPLRTAASGSMLNVQVSESGWYRVEFQDPQYGRRVGYIEKRFVSGVAVRPEAADLTIPEARSEVRPAAAPLVQDRPVAPRAPRLKFAVPAWETSAGWSLVHGDGVTVPLGWDASISGSVTPWFSVVGEVSGNYKTESAELFGTRLLTVNVKEHAFLGGPRFVGRFATGRINPFGQFLTGLTLTNVGGNVLDIVEFGGSDLGLTLQPGGGVDIGLSDRIALRMQVDFRTTFADSDHETNFRFVPGIVIRTGAKN